MLGWLLLFIISGWLFYKYRRTDINQNEVEPSSPSFSFYVIGIAILMVLVIILAAVLYSYRPHLPSSIKSPPTGTMMVENDVTDVWKVYIIKMNPTVSINSVHWYLHEDYEGEDYIPNMTKVDGMVSDIYGFKDGEGQAVTYLDNDLDAKVSPGDQFVIYPGVNGTSLESYPDLTDYSFRLKFDPTGDIIGDVSFENIGVVSQRPE